MERQQINQFSKYWQNKKYSFCFDNTSFGAPHTLLSDLLVCLHLPHEMSAHLTFPQGATAVPSLPEAEKVALENGGSSPGGS